MKKILFLLIIIAVLASGGCTNVKNNKKVQTAKTNKIQANSAVSPEKAVDTRFLNAKKTDGMGTVITKGKINKEKDFGKSFNEGLEMSSKLCISGDVIMIVMEYEEGGGQAVMSEYDNYLKFKNKDITIDEFMDNIVIKDMTNDEVKKARDAF